MPSNDVHDFYSEARRVDGICPMRQMGHSETYLSFLCCQPLSPASCYSKVCLDNFTDQLSFLVGKILELSVFKKCKIVEAFLKSNFYSDHQNIYCWQGIQLNISIS